MPVLVFADGHLNLRETAAKENSQICVGVRVLYMPPNFRLFCSYLLKYLEFTRSYIIVFIYKELT